MSFQPALTFYWKSFLSIYLQCLLWLTYLTLHAKTTDTIKNIFSYPLTRSVSWGCRSVLGGQTLHYIKDPTKLEAALDQMRLQAAWTSTHSSNYCISESVCVCVGVFSFLFTRCFPPVHLSPVFADTLPLVWNSETWWASWSLTSLQLLLHQSCVKDSLLPHTGFLFLKTTTNYAH